MLQAAHASIDAFEDKRFIHVDLIYAETIETLNYGMLNDSKPTKQGQSTLKHKAREQLLLWGSQHEALHA